MINSINVLMFCAAFSCLAIQAKAAEVYRYQCADEDAFILMARFVSGKKPHANIVYQGRELIVYQVPSGSGAKYQSQSAYGKPGNIFWIKGNAAMFEQDGKSVQCRLNVTQSIQ